MFQSHAYISARIAVSATPSASEETVRDPEMAGCSFRTCNTREREREREREPKVRNKYARQDHACMQVVTIC